MAGSVVGGRAFLDDSPLNLNDYPGCVGGDIDKEVVRRTRDHRWYAQVSQKIITHSPLTGRRKKSNNDDKAANRSVTRTAVAHHFGISAVGRDQWLRLAPVQIKECPYLREKSFHQRDSTLTSTRSEMNFKLMDGWKTQYLCSGSNFSRTPEYRECDLVGRLGLCTTLRVNAAECERM